jgi:hypothetical protein
VTRVAILFGAVLLGWGVTKAMLQIDWASRIWPDLLILPIATIVLVRHPWIQAHRGTVVAICCALWGMLAFGGYNPLQSAWPIFNRPSTPMTKLLDYQATFSPDRVVVSEKFGAVLNGWGYRSVAHILMVPHLDLWRRYFPDLPAAEFNVDFNRFLHVQPIDEPSLRFLHPNVLGVPGGMFEKDFRWPARVTRLSGPVEHAHESGNVDARELRNGRLVVAGWAPWRGLAPGQTLTIYSDVDLRVVQFARVERPDVARVMNDPELAFSGFVLELQPVLPNEDIAHVRACLVAETPAYTGAILLGDGIGACPGTNR